MPVADKIFLFNAQTGIPTIKKGYGWIAEKRNSVMFGIDDLSQKARETFYLDTVAKTNEVPFFFPEMIFEVKDTEKGPKAFNIDVVFKYNNALFLLKKSDAEIQIIFPDNTWRIANTNGLFQDRTEGYYTAELSNLIFENYQFQKLRYSDDNARLLDVLADPSCRQFYCLKVHPIVNMQTTVDNLKDVLNNEYFLRNYLDYIFNAFFKPQFIEKLENDLSNALKLNLEYFFKTLGNDPEAISNFTDLVKTHLLESNSIEAIQKYYNIFKIVDSAKNAFLLCLEKIKNLLQKSSIIVLDIESDQNQIRELAINIAGEIQSAKDSKDIQSLIKRIVEYNDQLLIVGHNIKKWDIPILERHGLLLKTDWIFWDTLEIEIFLNPVRSSLALKTEHRAESDVELTLKLFESQIYRLIIDAQLDEIMNFSGLEKLRNSSAFDFFLFLQQEVILNQLSKGNEFIRFKQESDNFFIDVKRALPLLDNLLERMVSGSNSRLFVIPDVLIPFALHRKRSLIISKYHTEAVQITEEALTGGGYGSFFINVMRRFLSICKEQNLRPYTGMLSYWLMDYFRSDFASLREGSKISDIQKYSELVQNLCLNEDVELSDNGGSLTFSFNSLKLIVFIDPATFTELINIIAFPESINPVIILPEVIAATFKIKICEIEESALSELLIGTNDWDFFSRNEYRRSLDLSLAKKLSDSVEEIRPFLWMDNFWIAEDNDRRYFLYGNHSVHKLHRADQNSLGFPKNFGFGSIEVISFTKTRNAESDESERLNPTTNYRRQYWTIQSIIFDIVAPGVPTIFVVSREEEIDSLNSLFKSLGYSVADKLSIFKNIEFLTNKHSSVQELMPFSGKRLYIIHHSKLIKILEMLNDSEVNIVLDSIPLEEQWLITFQYSEKNSDEDTFLDTDNPNEDEPEDDISIDTGVPGSKIKKYEISEAIKSYSPFLRLLSTLIGQISKKIRLICLDARFEQAWQIGVDLNMKVLKIEIPDFEMRYSKRLEIVSSFIFSPAPEFELDEDWKEIIQNKFLQNKGIKGNIGLFSDIQDKYLDLIIKREKDILVSLPTGGGKSILFQGPSLYRGIKSNRFSLVITPLKALMVDQVENLWRLGFYTFVEYLTGDLSQIEIDDILRRFAGGEIILLYVAPERFRSSRFRKILQKRIKMDGGPEYWIFDEAHCISQWGLDFRPDYFHASKTIINYRKTGINSPALFLSATMTEQVYKSLNGFFDDSKN